MFHANKDSVYRFAYRMLGSAQDAEDVAQEVFLAFWRRPGAYRGERGALRPFLLGIARNLVLKLWRARRPTDELDPETLVCRPVDLESIELQRAVAEAVGRLPLLQREALVLSEYDELSLEEIASVTGVNVAAVKSRQHRARQNLKKLLSIESSREGARNEHGIA